MASRRAALSFNASLIATFSIYLFINFIYLFIYLFINNSPHMKIPSGVTDNVHLTTESSWSAHSGLTSRDFNQASTAKASETRPRTEVGLCQDTLGTEFIMVLTANEGRG